MRHRADGDRQGADPPWKSLGLRQRRRLTRHLAHCEPCRRAARQAVWTNPSSAPRPCRRRSPRSCRCFHRCVGTVAPPRRIPPSLARCRWRRDRWGRERCRRSMRSGTQAVHWAGSGGRPWLPPLRQRYWRGRGPGWWSGSVAPPARLTIRTLRLLLWGPSVTSEATRSARGLSSVQQAAGLKLHRPAPKRSSGARQAAHRRGPRARTSTVPAGKKSPAAVRRPGGDALAQAWREALALRTAATS